MKRLAVLIMAAVTLSGCFDKGGKSESLSSAENAAHEITVSSNSPDITVKSWWSLRNAGSRLNKEICLELAKSRKELEGKLRSIAGNEINVEMSCQRMAETYSRTIESVDVQSDTRAIVNASVKNITPLDDGASLSSEEKSNKERGSLYRYILERPDAKSGWAISKIYGKSFYSSSWEEILKKIEPYNHIYVSDGNQ